MHADIAELQEFYASRQGQLARRLIGHQLRQLWADLSGRVVVGLGYAVPFLPSLEGSERAVALMPQAARSSIGPVDGCGHVAFVQDDDLPLADGSVDRLLLAHALETSPKSRRLMREVWRVLADGGRVVALVPNRRGLWCWSERTPFGYGQPYSAGQLQRMLRSYLFEPLATRRALYLPPTGSGLLLRFAVPVERLGLRFASQLSGVVLVEAEKRIYLPTATVASRKKARRPGYAPVPQG
jgi:SAM-dependent methyltransferase